MLDMAKVTPNDFVMDLGSGDGRTVITAAKRGVKAMGVEFNPDMVALSKKAAAKEGVSDRATFVEGDLFKADLSKATVITMFLLPSINMQLRPSLLDLKPGTRIVANTFTMEDWQADETQSVTDDCSSWCTALLWIVPAKVQGTWKTPQGNLTLTQQFQMVTGTLERHGDRQRQAQWGSNLVYSRQHELFWSRQRGGTAIAGGNLTRVEVELGALKPCNFAVFLGGLKNGVASDRRTNAVTNGFDGHLHLQASTRRRPRPHPLSPAQSISSIWETTSSTWLCRPGPPRWYTGTATREAVAGT